MAVGHWASDVRSHKYMYVDLKSIGIMLGLVFVSYMF